MKKNNNKNSSARRKLAAATAMLLISALVLSSATYAWFTMNKEVRVTNMQVKAHAEEGLLINEVANAKSNTWDEEAIGGYSSAIALRPASTSNLSTWWHANSKKSYSEAGASGSDVDTVNTVDIDGSGTYYKNITGNNVTAYNFQSGSDGTKAETIVYYNDASFGSGGQYDDGEGYYIMYKYYMKSSKSDAGTYNIPADKLNVKVSAVKTNTDNSGTANHMDLDKALRVGVKFADYDCFKIFAPLYDADQTYKVADGEASINNTDVVAYTTETAIGKASGANGADDTTAIEIPNVVTDGIEVDVYVWFEGEDPNCKSDNLAAVLDSYEITVNFKDTSR